MMQTVKHTLHSFGDRGGDFAKTIGSGTADLAKRFGNETADLAKRIGPRRGLIGLAALAVAIGGSVVLVRYLRARNLRNLENKRGANDTGEDFSADRSSKSGNRSSAQRSPITHPSH